MPPWISLLVLPLCVTYCMSPRVMLTVAPLMVTLRPSTSITLIENISLDRVCNCAGAWVYLPPLIPPLT